MGILQWTSSLVNHAISPATRKQYYDNASAFANEQPLLFIFLLIQLFLSFTPLTIFLTFVLGTLAFSLITAALFSLFWLGIALLVLVPILFIIVIVGIVVFIWAVSSFLIARWVYNLVPASVKGGVEVMIPNKKKFSVEMRNGEVKDETRNIY